jgi:hypothetical protein
LKKLETMVVSVLLAGFALVCFESQKHNSVTIDESAHLPAGYYYWNTGDFGLYNMNPPLIKLIESAPLLRMRPSLELDLSQLPKGGLVPWEPWVYGADFMDRNQQNYLRIFQAGRVMIIFLGVLLGLLVYLCSRFFYGRAGGVLSLAVFAMCPNLIAHSQLATVDIGASLFMALALLTLIFYLKKPTWPRALFAGVALGLALLSKFSAISLLPFYALAPWFMVRPFRSDRFSFKTILVRYLQVGTMILIWLFLVMACYRFEDVFQKTGNLNLISTQMKTVQKYTRFLPAPFPEKYLAGLDFQLTQVEQGQAPNYLLGRWYQGIKWRYMPVALLVKVPVPVQILFLFALCLALGRRGKRIPFKPEEILVLLVMALVFYQLSFRNRLQIGVRYLLPLFPLAYILIGRIVAGWEGASLLRKVMPAVMIAWLLGESVFIYPHYLSYFNEFCGGPKNGRRVLLDSNLDWGQDLPGLAEFMKQNGVKKIDLWYFGTVLPELYGIKYQPLGMQPKNEYLAVSAQLYYGQGVFNPPLFYFQPRERMFKNQPSYVVDTSTLVPYLHKKPVATCGYSILVFKNN